MNNSYKLYSNYIFFDNISLLNKGCKIQPSIFENGVY